VVCSSLKNSGKGSAGIYRYGFNGKEKDEEGMGGGGSTYDYGFRIYNPQIGKFLSVDPLTKSYPWYTPYQFAGNMPIAAIDLDGLEEQVVVYGLDNDGNSIVMAVFNDREIIEQLYEQNALGNNQYGTFANVDQYHAEGLAPTTGTLEIHEYPGGSRHASYDKDGVPVKSASGSGDGIFMDKYGIINYGNGSFGDDKVRAKNTTWMEGFLEVMELWGWRKPKSTNPLVDPQKENPVKQDGGSRGEVLKDASEEVVGTVEKVFDEGRKQERTVHTESKIDGTREVIIK
jgi:RHS repeat-associated protein